MTQNAYRTRKCHILAVPFLEWNTVDITTPYAILVQVKFKNNSN